MIYSYKGLEPKELPHRIVLSDGTTKTDISTFTEEDITDAGFTLAPDKPLMTSDISLIHWSMNLMDWVVIYKTPEQKLQEALIEWKKQREEQVSNILVQYGIKETIVDEETQESVDIPYLIQGDEISQDRMNRALNVLPDEESTVPWLDVDNTVIQLNKAALREILFNAGTQQSALWNLNRPVLSDFKL